MKLYDVNENEQKGLVNDSPVIEDSGPLFDNTTAGKRISAEGFLV